MNFFKLYAFSSASGDIHLALFSKNKRFHSGRFEAFMRHAIDDVNSGQFRYPMRQVFTGNIFH